MWTWLWLVLLCARDRQALSHFILKFILWRVMLDTAIGSGMDMWPKPNQWQSSQGILLELPGNRFLGGTSGKEPACQCMRHKGCHFDPWVEKIPWRKAWQPTPVFLPGESPWAEKSGGLQSMGSQRVGHDWVTEVNWTERPWPNLLVLWMKSSCSWNICAVLQISVGSIRFFLKT